MYITRHVVHCVILVYCRWREIYIYILYIYYILILLTCTARTALLQALWLPITGLCKYWSIIGHGYGNDIRSRVIVKIWGLIINKNKRPEYIATEHPILGNIGVSLYLICFDGSFKDFHFGAIVRKLSLCLQNMFGNWYQRLSCCIRYVSSSVSRQGLVSKCYLLSFAYIFITSTDI